ncbi:MAG: acetate--CoA ligase [Candidatus Aenigmatarchaeota archaeon]|nr:MAG: acetate--CoA ligase [Candidatus Aenigmarchaeota archaeon]
MATEWVVRDEKEENVFWPSSEMKKRAWVSDEKIYDDAKKDQIKFWEKLAEDGLVWFKKWDKAYVWEKPYFKWFVNGELNACYNCVDRHVKTWRRNKAAIIWVPEPIDEDVKVLTYYDLYREVNRFANALKKLGVKKGDRVVIYLPMIPQVQIAMLACARIGAIHSVVFSAFSAESLKQRIEDSEAKVLITADGYYRRGKIIDLKRNADSAVQGTTIKNVIVVRRIGNDINMVKGRDYFWDEIVKECDGYCEAEKMKSQDILFILYTSGTTGKPKGIIHDTGGYLTQAHWTAKWDFDLHDDDVFWCTADIGWVTGHTYACYGPLSNGATLLVYEGAPDYPDIGRWWKIIEEFGVTTFYTAPTAIRMFIRYGEDLFKRYDLSSLRILGTVGEPIDTDAWLWYFKNIGGCRCPIIDTWWQTETGGTLINSLPGIGPFKPTFAGKSFPGTVHTVVDEDGNELGPGEVGYLVQKPPFAPGLLHGVWKNEKKYIEEYWEKFNFRYYYTSDGAYYDEDGNFRLTGRVDDVMKVAGHRLSSAEVEDAIDEHPNVRESAVVPRKDEIKGEVPIAFVVLKHGEGSDSLKKEIIDFVVKGIGPTAKPAEVYFVSDLPKTRSGKIMRRILRGIVNNKKELGNLTTLMNPECIDEIKVVVGYKPLE